MKNKYFVILAVGLIVWVAETMFFGFNREPQSGLEGFLDSLALMLMVFGGVGDIMTNLQIHKHYHNNTDIKTNN